MGKYCRKENKLDANNSKIYAKFRDWNLCSCKTRGTRSSFKPKIKIRYYRAIKLILPRHIIERAIEKAKGGGDGDYQELRYEGFGPNGSMIIVDALTNNVNRTAADVRAAYSKTAVTWVLQVL